MHVCMSTLKLHQVAIAISILNYTSYYDSYIFNVWISIQVATVYYFTEKW